MLKYLMEDMIVTNIAINLFLFTLLYRLRVKKHTLFNKFLSQK